MIATRIAKELLSRGGAEITVIAEGLSVEEWRKANLPVRIYDEGPLKIDEPWDITPSAVFLDTKPDVLMTGLSSPIRSEEIFIDADYRNGFNVPVVVLDDNWGAVNRCRFPADLVLTIDELGRRLIQECTAYAHHNYQVVVVGDLSATVSAKSVADKTKTDFSKAVVGADYSFILLSQKWQESEDVISTALAVCAVSVQVGKKIAIVPRFHPGASEEDKKKWNGSVANFERQFPGTVRWFEGCDSDSLATLADGIFAATGSGLRAAAYAGKIPICVWSPHLSEKLQGESGTKHHPLVLGGAALQVTLGQTLDVVGEIEGRQEEIQSTQKKLLRPVPFDVQVAADAVVKAAKAFRFYK
ncbi:MAG: hypothetical protein Q8P52_01785 [bacterium]|nr:hypothetical protein [bacterium]